MNAWYMVTLQACTAFIIVGTYTHPAPLVIAYRKQNGSNDRGHRRKPKGRARDMDGHDDVFYVSEEWECNSRCLRGI